MFRCFILAPETHKTGLYETQSKYNSLSWLTCPPESSAKSRLLAKFLRENYDGTLSYHQMVNAEETSRLGIKTPTRTVTVMWPNVTSCMKLESDQELWAHQEYSGVSVSFSVGVE